MASKFNYITSLLFFMASHPATKINNGEEKPMSKRFDQEIQKAIQKGYVEGLTIKCERCAGTGLWPTIDDPEGLHHKCFRCDGTGQVQIMSIAQVALIRKLMYVDQVIARESAFGGTTAQWSRIEYKMAGHLAGMPYLSMAEGRKIIGELMNSKKTKEKESLDQCEIDFGHIYE